MADPVFCVHYRRLDLTASDSRTSSSSSSELFVKQVPLPLLVAAQDAPAVVRGSAVTVHPAVVSVTVGETRSFAYCVELACSASLSSSASQTSFAALCAESDLTATLSATLCDTASWVVVAASRQLTLTDRQATVSPSPAGCTVRFELEASLVAVVAGKLRLPPVQLRYSLGRADSLAEEQIVLHPDPLRGQWEVSALLERPLRRAHRRPAQDWVEVCL